MTTLAATVYGGRTRLQHVERLHPPALLVMTDADAGTRSALAEQIPVCF